MIFDDSGDVRGFPSIEVLLDEIEPFLLDKGPSLVFDADGRAIRIGTDPERESFFGRARRTVVLGVEDPPRHAAELQELLREHFRRVGAPHGPPAETLRDLVDRFTASSAAWRPSRFPDVDLFAWLMRLLGRRS